MIEHCRFVCEKARLSLNEQSISGKLFVVLVVHLQRGLDNAFSFDFDSQWCHVFLDSVEPAADTAKIPPLSSMLNKPLIEVVSSLDFVVLLQGCFRAALSRLVYPHRRSEEDLTKQIQTLLGYLG